MNIPKGILYALIILEFLAICYLLYNQNGASFTSDNGTVAAPDSLRALRRQNEIRDSALLTGYLKTGVVDFQQLNLPVDGQCRNAASFGGTIPPNYLQVNVSVKGSHLRVPEFFIGDKEYASSRQCFHVKPEEHTLSTYVRYSRADSILPVKIGLQTDAVRNNAFEYSVVVKDHNGKQLAKLPADAESRKGTIQFISSYISFRDTIQLKQVK
jgi:hypothetical protein